MAIKSQRAQRRTDALSKERIVDMAVRILDSEGESALTFRALTAGLATGFGAIYWHVADKEELLTAATDHVLTRVMTGVAENTDPREAIRAIALAIFDTVEMHPWVGAQISREPWQSTMPQILENIVRQLQALGLSKQAQLSSASVLMNYFIGVAAQISANVCLLSRDTDRSALLAHRAERVGHPQGTYPVPHLAAALPPDRVNRKEFLAGVELIQLGIATQT
jgi:AcrR family transcriptional regulator